MYYSDFENINEDELTGRLFGEQEQLEVLGWVKGPHGRHYVLKCSICKLDPEMSGDGLVVSYKSTLLKGHIPCLCAKNFRLTEEQNAVRVRREADKRGFKFLGWKDGEYTNVARTYLKLECPVHGIWESGITVTFLKGIGCPSCGGEARDLAKYIPDDILISKFMSTGCFPESTLFTRSNRENKYGQKPYWDVYCPTCDSRVQSLMSNLLEGGRSCGCGINKQTFAYINAVMDGETEVALKFGITANLNRRVKQQNMNNPFNVVNLFNFKFNEISQCKASEKEVKNTVVTGVLSRSDMPDGFSETTYVYNLDIIIQIYEKYGGIRQ